MADDPVKPRRRALDQMARISEVLFGLIMVLGFTGSLSVAEAGRESIRTMLIGALGCNLAWGLIDAVFYLMGSQAERAQGLRALRAARQATDPGEAHRVIAGALPPLLASILQPAELETIRQRLRALPEPPDRMRLSRDDWKGAAAVFLLVFLSTFPVVVPFLFMADALRALRISHAIAIAMLFTTGYAYGRVTGRPPWLGGMIMVFLGAGLVGLTMALGG